MARGSPSNPAATCCKQAIVGEQGDDEKQMGRRSSRDGAGAKQPTDYDDIAEAGGLATSSKTPLIDVELDCMTAALARVFKAPGAAGDSGANLFYVFNGALHPFCGVFEPNASMDVQVNMGSAFDGEDGPKFFTLKYKNSRTGNFDQIKEDIWVDHMNK